jgi:hypothetical protein
LNKYLKQKKIVAPTNATSRGIIPITTLKKALEAGLQLGISEVPKAGKVRARAADGTADSAGVDADASNEVSVAGSVSSTRAI